jgi:hypothetical protein
MLIYWSLSSVVAGAISKDFESMPLVYSLSQHVSACPHHAQVMARPPRDLAL